MADDPGRVGLGYLLVGSATALLGYVVKALSERLALPPSKVELDEAQAEQIRAGLYQELLKELKAERTQLRDDLAVMSADLTEERRVRRMLEVRVDLLEGELAKSKERESALLQTIAEQKGEIERLTHQVDELRAVTGNGAG